MTAVPEAMAFYQHYWGCPHCNQWRLCATGRPLKREYDIEYAVRRIFELPTDLARRKACREVDPEIWPAVRDKITRRQERERES